MRHTEPEVEKSFVRSKHRLAVLLMLSSLTEAYAGQLARACNVPARIVRWVMLGHGEFYSADLSLVKLGLAIEINDAAGRRWMVTNKGRRWARKMGARRARQDRRREAVRESDREFHQAREALQADTPPSAEKSES